MTIGKLYGIGVGPGDPGLITVKATEMLKQVDIIFTAISRQSERSVSGSVVDSIADCNAQRVGLVFAMKIDWDDRMKLIRENAAIILEHLKRGLNCAFTTIGDPMTYSTFGYLFRELRSLEPKLEVEIIPGVNSWSALAAAAQTIMVEDKECLCVVPSHDEEDALSPLRDECAGTVVFLKTYNSRNRIIEQAREQFPDAELLYGANLGLANEFISTDLEAITGRGKDYLSMLVVKKGGHNHDGQ